MLPVTAPESTPLQDAAAALTSTERAILIVANPADPENPDAPAYTVRYSGDEFDVLESDEDRRGVAKVDMALSRVNSVWPQFAVVEP